MNLNISCADCKMQKALVILKNNRECIECINNEIPGLGDMLDKIIIKFGV